MSATPPAAGSPPLRILRTAYRLPLLAWQEPAALLPMSVLTLLIVWRHRGNLRDLFAGRERHF